MARRKPSSVNGDIEMPIISIVRGILATRDKHLIKGLIQTIHSFLEGEASKQLLRVTESEESDPSGSRAGVKLGLVGKDAVKKNDNLLSKEFSKFLKHKRQGQH